MVPADRPEQWPRIPGERYLPIAAEEFEQRLALLLGEPLGPDGSNTARLAHASYTAELVGADLLGQAVWTFDQTAGKSSIVILDGCKLSLTEVKWLDAVPPNKNGLRSETAIVGNDQFGRLAAVIDRPGNISCKWSSRGGQEQDDVIRFNLMLPACAKSVLEVSLPDDRMLLADHGIVSSLDRKSVAGRTWRVELGGVNNVDLSVVKQASELAADERIRQALAYRFSSRGMELVAEFALDVGSHPLRRVKIQVDSPLVAVQAHLGTISLSPVATVAETKGKQEFIIEFPQPIRGSGNVLRVTAVAPAEPGTQLRLPLIRIAGARWEQGTAKLTFEQPLELDDLDLIDCRQTNTGLESNASSGKTCDIEFFNEDPTISVNLARRKEQISVATGTSITLRANEGLGHCEALFSATEGSCFNLEADIARQWIIDNVESNPPGLIADWSQQSSQGRPAKLKVRLTKPIVPGRGLRLAVTGRRRRAPWGDSFRADDLAMLSFSNIQTIRRLVHVQALEPYQLQARGDENLRRLNPDTLTPDDADFFVGGVSGLMFVNDEFARPLIVSLTAKAPQYEADIRSEMLVADDRLTESYRFLISPKGREIGRLSVRFSQPRIAPVLWTIEGEQAGALSARRLVEDSAARAAGGDTWEVTLPTSHSTPFTLLATRRTVFQSETPIALASLIGADSQRGIVQVSSSGEAPPEVRSSRRIKALPVEASLVAQTSTALAAFRYNPDEDTLLSAEPPLVIVPSAAADINSRAWIWQERLQSIYHRTTTEQVLTCRVEIVAPTQLRFTPPAGASLKGAWVDNHSVIDDIDSAAGIWNIELSGNSRFTSVMIEWTEEPSTSGTICQLIASWPVCNLPILSRRWTLQLPPGSCLVDAESGGAQAVIVPWTKRLFGPLAASDVLMQAGRETSAQSNDDAVKKSSADSDASSLQNYEASPWHNGSQTSDRLLGPSGLEANEITPDVSSVNLGEWTTYQFNDVGDASISVWIADEASLTAWSWGMFVLMAASRWWIGRIQPAADIVVLALLTAIALLAPTAVASLTAAVWLGYVAGRLLVWLVGLPKGVVITVEMPNGLRSGLSKSVQIATCIGLIVTARYTLVHADEVPAIPESPGLRPWQVLIPVDSDQRPTGGLYYLPESFHAALYKLNPTFGFGPPEYLITTAEYRARIGKSADLGQAAIQAWQATFDVDSLRDHVTVALPIGSDGSVLIPDAARIDGQSATFHWDDRTRRTAFEMSSQGSHRLELQFRPIAKDGGFDLAVPSVSTAQVELESSGARVQLNSASGTSHATPDESSAPAPATALQQQRRSSELKPETHTGRSSFWLGPASRIVITRLEEHQATRANSQVRYSVDELYWLRVRPNAVTIDSRLKVNVESGQLRHIDLVADPLLSTVIDSEDGTISESRRVPGDPNLLRLEFTRPITGKATIDVPFVVKDASGVGQILLPDLECRGGKTTHRSWAASVESTLIADMQHGAGNVSDSQEFVTLWGKIDKKPQFVWSQPSKQDEVTLTVRPRDPKIEARYQTALHIDQREASVREAVTVAITDGQVFQFHISVPSQLEIDHVTAHNENVDLGSRWTRSRPNLLTVFFDSAASGEVALSISGHLPVPSDSKLLAPILRVEGAENQGCQVIVLRHPDALTSIFDPGGFQSIAENDWPARLVDAERDGLIDPPTRSAVTPAAILETDHDAQPPLVGVKRNPQQLRVLQVTAMNRASNAWMATVDLDVIVEQGLVDTLRFELPANWIGPFELSPKIPCAVEQLAGENRRQLVVRPERALDHSFHLRVASPLIVAAGQRPNAPDVRLLGAANQRQFLLLPRRQEDQQLEWDRRGLAARPLPESLSNLVGDTTAYRSYQVVSTNARAQLKSVDRGAENPQVRLADVEMLWALSGHCAGIAAFDLEPGDAGSCQLAVPAGFRLIRVELDGAPAQLAALGAEQLSVALGNNKLPRRLELIFSGRLSTNSHGQLELTAPSLVGLPVERSIWHIIAPAAAGRASLPSGKSVSEIEHYLSRLKVTASLADAAGSTLIDEPIDDSSRWYTAWLHRFAQVRASLVNAKSVEPDNEQSRRTEAELNAIDQDQIQLAHRLGLGQTLGELTNGKAVPFGWLQAASAVAPLDDSQTFAMLHGGGASLATTYQNWPAKDRFIRTLLAILVLSGSAALVFVIYKQWIALDGFTLWPQALGMTVGVSWWFWLVPGWLGLAIIAASLYAAWWQTLRSPKPVNPARPASESGSKRLRGNADR